MTFGFWKRLRDAQGPTNKAGGFRDIHLWGDGRVIHVALIGGVVDRADDKDSRDLRVDGGANRAPVLCAADRLSDQGMVGSEDMRVGLLGLGPAQAGVD